MKKRGLTIIVIVILALLLAGAAGALVFKPVARFQAYLNAQIAASLNESGLGWQAALTDMAYEFPNKIKGQAYLRHEGCGVFIEVSQIKLTPRLTTLWGASPMYDMQGLALGGDFSGYFSTGAHNVFKLVFNNLHSRHISGLDTATPLIPAFEAEISGVLDIDGHTVKSDTVINSLTVKAPDFFGLGDLHFYEGGLNFEMYDDEVRVNRAFIKNDDITAGIEGLALGLHPQSRLNFTGALAVSNPGLVIILNLLSGNKTPRFSFAITGTLQDPQFNLLP